jgi:hypothetical protein
MLTSHRPTMMLNLNRAPGPAATIFLCHGVFKLEFSKCVLYLRVCYHRLILCCSPLSLGVLSSAPSLITINIRIYGSCPVSAFLDLEACE